MHVTISSPANSLIKKLAGLRQKKYRIIYDMFLVDGEKILEMGARAGLRPMYIIADQSANIDLSSLQFRYNPEQLITTSETIIAKISNKQTPQSLVGIYKISDVEKMMSSRDSNEGIVIGLNAIQDPGNLGAIIRTADALGVKQIYLDTHCVDIYNDKVISGSMGSIFNVLITVVPSLMTVVEEFINNKFLVFVTTLENSAQPLWQCNFLQPTFIIFGNEGQGVAREILDSNVKKMYIPMEDSVESLNVAAAAAMVMYETKRQKAVI